MYYSAKVSDFEAAESGSVGSGCRSIVVGGEESEGDTSEGFSVEVSSDDESNSQTETESDTHSRMELESYVDDRDHDAAKVPLAPNIFLTQGKTFDEPEDSHSKTSDSELSLIQATKNGDIPLIRKLITKGCNLEATDSNHRTALHLACSLGRLQIVRLLVEGGANVDASSVAGQTPLHEACISGRYEVLEEMLSEVADLDMVDCNGLSAAHYCAMNGEVKCLTLLCNQVRNFCLHLKLGTAIVCKIEKSH